MYIVDLIIVVGVLCIIVRIFDWGISWDDCFIHTKYLRFRSSIVLFMSGLRLTIFIFTSSFSSIRKLKKEKPVQMADTENKVVVDKKNKYDRQLRFLSL
jgi:hypothetical protein